MARKHATEKPESQSRARVNKAMKIDGLIEVLRAIVDKSLDGALRNSGIRGGLFVHVDKDRISLEDLTRLVGKTKFGASLKVRDGRWSYIVSWEGDEISG